MLGSNNFFLDFCLMVLFFSFFPPHDAFLPYVNSVSFPFIVGRWHSVGVVVVEALLSESSKSLAVEALQEHMIQGHQNLGSRGAAAVFPWRFLRLYRWGIFKRKGSFSKDHVSGVLARNTSGLVTPGRMLKVKFAHKIKQTRESISDSMGFQTSDLWVW